MIQPGFGTHPLWSQQDQITDMLRVLRTADGSIQASALVSADGLVIASDLSEQDGEDRVSAMSAAMLS